MGKVKNEEKTYHIITVSKTFLLHEMGQFLCADRSWPKADKGHFMFLQFYGTVSCHSVTLKMKAMTFLLQPSFFVVVELNSS